MLPVIRFQGPQGPFQLQYISDLHLEKKTSLPSIPKLANNLALLGDIGDPYSVPYSQLLQTVSLQWQKVYILSGNHEYWQKTYNYDEVDRQIHKVCRKFHNVEYLNNSCSTLDGVTILGTTLWSRIVNNRSGAGDDYYIKDKGQKIGKETLDFLHQEAVNFLDREITGQPTVVLTHFLPSYLLILDRYKNGYYQHYQDRFASHLEFLIRPGVRFWAFGHTHARFVRKINGIPCGVNACKDLFS